MLEEKTHLPVVGVVPYLKVDIEDEDSLSDRLTAEKRASSRWMRRSSACRISPTLRILCRWNSTRCWACATCRRMRELGAPDLVILPGTKNTVDDLLWLRQSGLEAAVQKLAAGGTPVLGVCGGYQMLGKTLDDSAGTESGHPQTLRGLGLLPTRTVFTNEKRRTQSTATTAAPFAGAELDRLRDPHRPYIYTGAGRTLLHPGGRHARGLCAGQCVRHLPARPV